MRSLVLTLSCLLLMATVSGQQVTGNYSYAINGMKSAFSIPPGFSYSNITHSYYASQYRDQDGKITEVGTLHAILNISVFSYAIKKKFLGGKYWADIGIPITNLAPNPNDLSLDPNKLGIGDLYLVPLSLSWDFDRIVLIGKIGGFVPIGRFEPGAPNNTGKGFLSVFFTGGFTFFIDKKKQFHLTAINTYEIPFEQRGTKITPGQANALEWGLGTTFEERFNIGIVGFDIFQTTKQQGGDPALANLPNYQIHGIGLGLGYITSSGFSFFSRTYFEYGAINRTQGTGMRFVISYAFPNKK